MNNETRKEHFVSTRRQYGLTQQQLAELLGISVSTVRAIEGGNLPVSDTNYQKLLDLCPACDDTPNIAFRLFADKTLQVIADGSAAGLIHVGRGKWEYRSGGVAWRYNRVNNKTFNSLNEFKEWWRMGYER